MFLIRQVDLIPPYAVSVHAAGQRHAEMPDGERLNQRTRPEVELGDDIVTILFFRAQLLDSPDDVSILGADT
jgi:hypothetical protein